MLKQKVKYFITGFLISSLLFSTMTVFGESIEKTIKVVFNGAKVYLNGNLADLKDGNGNKVEPMVYNGTTYLPVRAISDAFKQNVEWDAKNNSIWIGQRPELGTPNIWLSKFDYIEKTKDFNFNKINKDTFKDNTGKTYQDGILFNGFGYEGLQSQSSITYLLNQKYKRFKATYVLPYENKDDDNKLVIRIYGDDEILYTSSEMKKGSNPENIDLDVSNVIKLKIECYNGWGSDKYGKPLSTRVLANAGLYE